MAVTIPDARNPAAADGLVAWDGASGVVVAREHADRAPEPFHVLPGIAPALGGGRLAWIDGDVIRIVRTSDFALLGERAALGATAVAISDRWLAVRRTYPDREVIEFEGEGRSGVVAEATRAARLGRPVLAAAILTYHHAQLRASVISTVDFDADARLPDRRSKLAQLTNPAHDGASLVYVRQTSRLQQLVLARAGTTSRVLLRLNATSVRDRGFERGHSHRTRTPRPTPAAREHLWTTALSQLYAYVTIAPVAHGATPPRVVQIRRP